MKKIFFLLVLFFFFLPLSSMALGLSVRPSELRVIIPEQSSVFLSIKNISLEPTAISVYPDAFASELKINPSELVLMPEEVARIEIAFVGQRESGAVKKTNLSVLARSLDQKRFNAASGLKIPLTIYLPTEPLFWSKYLIVASIFFGFLFLGAIFRSVYYWQRRRQKRKNTWYRLNFLKIYRSKGSWFGRRR